jgi:hypothetical protein
VSEATGEAISHLSRAALEAGLAALPPAPRDAGIVVLVVARPSPGARELPARCSLAVGIGVARDRWASEKKDPAAEISVMRADVALLFAHGQELSLFGDNLIVDLDLSARNLPVGTRLRVGGALCEVTKKPHTGCKKFGARAGQDALELTKAPELADQRLRGLYVRVVEPGEVGPGDAIEVLSRSALGCLDL